MTEWILIGLGVIGGVLLATHAAGVAFVAGRVLLSGRRRQKQFSPN